MYNNNDSSHFIGFWDDYEISSILRFGDDIKLEQKFGHNFFNVVNNYNTIYDVLKDTLHRYINLSSKVKLQSNYYDIANYLFSKLTSTNISPFIASIIRCDLENILNEAKYDYYNLLQEKQSLENWIKDYNPSKLKSKNKILNEYVEFNKYKYIDLDTYESIMASPPSSKYYELVQEYKINISRLKQIDEVLNDEYFNMAIVNKIKGYIKNFKLVKYISRLLIVEEKELKKDSLKSLFKMILAKSLTLPSSTICYAKEINGILFHLNDDSINASSIDDFLPYTVYNVSNFFDLLSIYLAYFAKNKTKFLICKNCKKLFIPYGKQLYCDNLYRNGKTCQQLSGDMKNNEDKVYVLYRSNYKTQFNKMVRNLKKDENIKPKFELWKKRAIKHVAECKSGIISYEDLVVWFKQSQNWNK